ncbi:hypothetical protein IG193_01065 [Infirmifilum lucidum]|uniref:Uncharacterized protein n=1 Tax=Infirmifilum lucidum TaxID=2776706 RepID=A0A7L9FH92_9CREN|nr:hypothetical protein [Infirmifilum lucidum]QOJ79087.1 hypothetical protein IG193_01065 [Infirmifilum lucidum]
MPARVVRPGAVLVSIAYAAVMVYLTLLVAFFGLAALHVFYGVTLLLDVERGYTTTITPTPLLYALALATAPLYLWHGYTSYTRGNKRALLIPPLIALAIAVVAVGVVAIGGAVATGFNCKATCSCGVKSWSGPSVSLSPLSVSMGSCECYACKP